MRPVLADSMRPRRACSRSRRIAGAAARFFAACFTILVAAGSPLATYLFLPDSLYDARDPIRQFMVTYGPPIPIVFAGMLGLLLVAARSRIRPAA